MSVYSEKRQEGQLQRMVIARKQVDKTGWHGALRTRYVRATKSWLQ
jgi:hypothetical protein